MKKIVFVFFMISLTVSLHSQGDVEIKDGISFEYVCMEFEGSHSQIAEKIPFLFSEIRNQELQPKITGDVIGVFLKYEFDRVAEITHHGPFDTVANSFNIILSYIGENGLEIDGPPAEIWIGNPSQDRPEDLKTRIIILVRKRENADWKRGV